jgi:hypothetical protein
MDLSKAVLYRGVPVNDAVLIPGKVLRGTTIETADYSGVQGIGYTEKRAAMDGVHASDVYLGPRDVTLQGLIYAENSAQLFDYLHTLRAIFSPTSAYQQSPGDRGFLPLQFQQPTGDTESFPGGVIPLQLFIRPRSLPSFQIARDRTGGVATRPQTMPWSVALWAKDPRVYVDPAQSFSVSGGPHTNVAGAAINRGDYESPLNVQINISTAPAAGQTVRIQGFNVDMTIKLLAEANRTYRWYGDDRVLMVQDSTNANAAQVLRMDLVAFATKNRKPMVPAAINPPVKPYTSSFTYSSTVALGSGSRLWWYEAFA